MPQLDKFITAMTASNARKLSIVAGESPALYVRGKREPVIDQRCTAAQVRRLVSEITPGGSRDELDDRGSARFEYRSPTAGAVLVEVQDWGGETHVQLSPIDGGEPEDAFTAGPAFERYAALVAELQQLRETAVRGEAELAAERAAEPARLERDEAALTRDWHRLRDVARQVNASFLPALDAVQPPGPAEDWRREFAGTVLDATSFKDCALGAAAFANALMAREAAARQLQHSNALADRRYLTEALARLGQLDERLSRLLRGDCEQLVQGYQALCAELVARLKQQALNNQLQQLGEMERANAAEKRRRQRIYAALGAVALFAVIVIVTTITNTERDRVKAILKDATTSLDAERYQETLDKLKPLADSWNSLAKANLATANRLCSAAANGLFSLAMTGQQWARAISLSKAEGLPCPRAVDHAKLTQNILDAAVLMPAVPDALAGFAQEKLLAKKDRGTVETTALDRLVERRGGPIQVSGSTARKGVNKGFFTSDEFTIHVEALSASWQPPNTVSLTLRAGLEGESDSAPVQCKPGLVKAGVTVLGFTPDCVFGRNRVANGERDVRAYQFTTTLEQLLAPGWALQMYTDWGEAMPISFSLYGPYRPMRPQPAAATQRQASSELPRRR